MHLFNGVELPSHSNPQANYVEPFLHPKANKYSRFGNSCATCLVAVQKSSDIRKIIKCYKICNTLSGPLHLLISHVKYCSLWYWALDWYDIAKNPLKLHFQLRLASGPAQWSNLAPNVFTHLKVCKLWLVSNPVGVIVVRVQQGVREWVREWSSVFVSISLC